MPPLTKSPETLCFLFVRWVGCPSVMGFCHRDNFKTAEGIKVKLGTSMYNDAKINYYAKYCEPYIYKGGKAFIKNVMDYDSTLCTDWYIPFFFFVTVSEAHGGATTHASHTRKDMQTNT